MGSDASLVDIAPDKIVQFETAVRMVPQDDAQNPQMISQAASKVNISMVVDDGQRDDAVRTLHAAYFERQD